MMTGRFIPFLAVSKARKETSRILAPIGRPPELPSFPGQVQITLSRDCDPRPLPGLLNNCGLSVTCFPVRRFVNEKSRIIN